jgi:hypothetical protein
MIIKTAPRGFRLVLECILVVVKYLFLMVAARNAGTHLVSNILAIDSSAPLEPPCCDGPTAHRVVATETDQYRRTSVRERSSLG